MFDRILARRMAAALAPLALLAAGPVAADEPERPNYRYIELDYIYAENSILSETLPDLANENKWYLPEGAAIRGSFDLFKYLLLRGSYYSGKGTLQNTTDVEASSGLLGVSVLAATEPAAFRPRWRSCRRPRSMVSRGQRIES